MAISIRGKMDRFELTQAIAKAGEFAHTLTEGWGKGHIGQFEEGARDLERVIAEGRAMLAGDLYREAMEGPDRITVTQQDEGLFVSRERPQRQTSPDEDEQQGQAHPYPPWNG